MIGIESVFAGVMSNTIYSIIHNLLKELVGDKEDELTEKVMTSIEKASSRFFQRYGNQFGEPSDSFIAREDNIIKIVKSTFYHESEITAEDINPEGFNGNEATYEAITYFITILKEEMMEHRQLSKIIIEKKTLKDIKEIKELVKIKTNSGSDTNYIPDKEEIDLFHNSVVYHENHDEQSLQAKALAETDEKLLILELDFNARKFFPNPPKYVGYAVKLNPAQDWSFFVQNKYFLCFQASADKAITGMQVEIKRLSSPPNVNSLDEILKTNIKLSTDKEWLYIPLFDFENNAWNHIREICFVFKPSHFSEVKGTVKISNLKFTKKKFL